MDVLAHVIESYFSNKADEVSRAFAVRAVRLAIGPLVEASAEGSLSAELRAQLYEASILGGLAAYPSTPHNKVLPWGILLLCCAAVVQYSVGVCLFCNNRKSYETTLSIIS